ncbi:MAG: LysE family translocator [Deinococcota bacterium]
MIASSFLPLLFTSMVSLMLTPGPAKLYLLGVSVSSGMFAGALISLGIYTSDLMHVLVSAAGVEVLFEVYPNVFTVFRFAGAAYLLYLAYKSFMRAKSPPELEMNPDSTSESKGEGLFKFYLTGLLINLFNPLAVVFYLSLLPQFVSSDVGASAGRQMFTAGAIMVTGFFLFHLVIALAAGTLRAQLAGNKSIWFIRIQAVIVGLVFCALALRVVLQ